MAERIQITLEVQGMTCDGCASHVEKALRGVAGVYDAKVPSWRAARATVVAGADVADETLARAIEKAGYRAQVRERRPVHAGQRFASGGEAYDLMIVGGGSAAFAAAIKAAELGANVGLVEAATLGGTCVNVGCVPSKTLIKAAELCYRAAYPKFEGLSACPPPSDWQRVVQQKAEPLHGRGRARVYPALRGFGVGLVPSLFPRAAVRIFTEAEMKIGGAPCATDRRRKAEQPCALSDSGLSACDAADRGMNRGGEATRRKGSRRPF